MALSLKTPSKAGTIRGCCIEGRRREARRYDDARGKFLLSVCLSVNPVGEPDALIGHVRFDERGWETERCRMAQATAPILDSTIASISGCSKNGRYWGEADTAEPAQ